MKKSGVVFLLLAIVFIFGLMGEAHAACTCSDSDNSGTDQSGTDYIASLMVSGNARYKSSPTAAWNNNYDRCKDSTHIYERQCASSSACTSISVGSPQCQSLTPFCLEVPDAGDKCVMCTSDNQCSGSPHNLGSLYGCGSSNFCVQEWSDVRVGVLRAGTSTTIKEATVTFNQDPYTQEESTGNTGMTPTMSVRVGSNYVRIEKEGYADYTNTNYQVSAYPSTTDLIFHLSICTNECSPRNSIMCTTDGSPYHDQCLKRFGCWVWVEDLLCSTGTTCVGNACTTCDNDPNLCTSGTRCSGNGVQTCSVDNDRDSCREWSSTVPCNADNLCSAGVCVPSESCVDSDDANRGSPANGDVTTTQATSATKTGSPTMTDECYQSAPNPDTLYEAYCASTLADPGRTIVSCPTDKPVCSNGACVSACTPSLEICDGKDNDCDGSVDENDANICGDWMCFHPGQSDAKCVCNDDNDCNDSNVCTINDRCTNPASSSALCAYTNNDGASCTINSNPGTCQSGTCTPPNCGNGVINSGEQCDGDNNLDGKTCSTVPGGYNGGDLKCKADCTFNTDDCSIGGGEDCTDDDGDTYSAISADCETGNDCDDTNETINPGAIEVCDDVDNDCDVPTEVDEGGVCTQPEQCALYLPGTACSELLQGDCSACGGSVGPNDPSGDGLTNKYCYWESGVCKLGGTDADGNICSVETLSYQCVGDQTSTDITYRNSCEPACSGIEGCVKANVPCPQVVDLPFFGMFGFGLSLIIIAGIYGYLIMKRKE